MNRTMTNFLWALLLVTSCRSLYAYNDAAATEVEVDANGETRTAPECEETAASAEDVNESGGGGGGGGIFSDIFSVKANNGAKPTATIFDDVGASISNLAKNILPPNDDNDHKEENMVSLDIILQTARDMTKTATPFNPERNFLEILEHFKLHFQESTSMVKEAFKHIDFDRLSLFALWYYVEKEESVKTPSWKRRKHRYHKRLDIDTILELHDATYLMQIAYLPTQELIVQEVEKFRNGTFEVVHAVTKEHPTEPAHFMMMPKAETYIEGNQKSKLIKTKKKMSELEIVIAVRGSGDPGDFVSDSMLNAVPYRSGKAHDGLARSGKFLADSYVDDIRRLWEVSGRDKVKLILVGYSLGAGVAAIAAMELNDYDFIDAQAIVIACPALLDLKQSESTKDYVTTIITDADLVTRMSGPTIANWLLDIMSHDWTDMALLDLELMLDNVGKTLLPVDKDLVMKWANDTLTKNYKPYFETITKERAKQELYPPGTCIHLFRNGVGWDGTYTPCSFFDEVEGTRTLVEDHLLEPGYHPALLGLAREAKKDLNFNFPHDLMALSEMIK